MAQEERSKSLVVDDNTRLYSFDAISADFYPEDVRPTSADALYFTKKGIGFVEFKTGFVQKISKVNFDRSKAKCSKITHEEYVCKDYWDIFKKKQDHEQKILVEALRLKAIESYITLEKKLLPRTKFQADLKKIHKCLTIVIDMEPVANMHENLSALAGVSTDDDAPKQKIAAALQRLKCRGEEHPFFYDEICVMSASEFKNFVTHATSNSTLPAELSL